MRRPIALAALSLALAACGSSAAPTKASPVTFGTSGGNIQPHKSVVRASAALQSRLRAVFDSGLASRQCPGTLPDIASEYIRFEGRTVTVHGSCEPQFTRLWNALNAASRG